MTHDYENALQYFDNNVKAPIRHTNAIRHALSEMQRMKTEGLVMVPSNRVMPEGWHMEVRAAQITGDEK
jgi:hypothetical protein